MSSLHVNHEHARDVLVDAIARFVETAESLSDYDLLAASRCYGWNVADVVVHVRTGLLEMLGGVTATTEEPADQDAATYWRDYDGGGDEVEAISWTRRTSSAYNRPAGAVHHLRMAGSAVVGAVTRMRPGRVAFQGHVLDSGDFLATWAVELAVHQLDLGHDIEVAAPTPSSMALALDTLATLAGTPKPDELTPVSWALLATGRRQATPGEMDRLGDLAGRLPILG